LAKSIWIVTSELETGSVGTDESLEPANRLCGGSATEPFNKELGPIAKSQNVVNSVLCNSLHVMQMLPKLTTSLLLQDS
jgi:hypothetical protein